MREREAERIIKKANKAIEKDMMYVTIMGLEYALHSVELYDGKDEKGKKIYLAYAFMSFNDDSTECTILLELEKLKEVVEKETERLKGEKENDKNV